MAGLNFLSSVCMLWDFVVIVFRFSLGRFTVTAFPAKT